MARTPLIAQPRSADWGADTRLKRSINERGAARLPSPQAPVGRGITIFVFRRPYTLTTPYILLGVIGDHTMWIAAPFGPLTNEEVTVQSFEFRIDDKRANEREFATINADSFVGAFDLAEQMLTSPHCERIEIYHQGVWLFAADNRAKPPIDAASA